MAAARLRPEDSEARKTTEQPNGPIRVIVGASSQDYPGWVRTQRHELDLTRRADWRAMFAGGTVSAIPAEHVREHLAPDEARIAARLLLRRLAR